DPDNPHVLLCVHGLTRSSADFEAIGQALGNKYRVIAADMPGRGRSDWLPSGAMYVVPFYVQACVALVARANAKTLDWMGTSMGGLIGMGYAGLPGCPIRKLILNDVGPRLDIQALKRIGEYVGKPVRFETLEQGREFIRAISTTFGPHNEEQWNQLTDTVLVKKDGYYTTHYDPAIGDSFKDLTSVTVEMHENALWEAYDHIQAETLVIRGETSDLLSAQTAEEMSRRGPKARVETIPGVGHAPTFMTDHQIEVVRSFLD
ncbi:MAG: alpha/beta hydrolase, partial [Limnobacter sp.]|nr:alpha/beta hydrolase [Limnobacter sp.]